MEKHEYVVESEHEGTRLDQWVAGANSELSRSRAARLIRAGAIMINELSAQPATKVRSGDRVAIRMPPASKILTPEFEPLEVLLETTEFVVINKPPKLTMYPGAGRPRGTLANRLIARFPDLRDVGHPTRPGIVHRLDKDTSGVVVVACTHAAYEHLAKAFAQRDIQKQYLLLVNGQPTPRNGHIDAPVGRDTRKRTRMAVTRRGRPAETTYEVLGSCADASLVIARPSSGRTHQIRVHMAAIGHAILGDHTYGNTKDRASRTMLHSWSLEFTGIDGRAWIAAAPPPPDFVSAAYTRSLKIPSTPSSGAKSDGDLPQEL